MAEAENSAGFYHLHVKNISRRFGRSVVAAAAYRAGETLWNEAEERDSAFGGRRDVVHAEIRIPDGAPDWTRERATLWNAVEVAEKRKDARLAKEIEFAIPRQLPREAWLGVVREMADAYVAQGFIVDLAIHEDGRGHNPHAHLLLTLRTIGADGFGLKNRQADTRTFVVQARQKWQAIANAALGKAGAAIQIDARSHRARGITKSPGKHRGPDRNARRRNRDIAQKLRDFAMVRLRDAQAIREMLKERAHVRYEQLHRRDDWPPIDREPPLDLSSAEREEFVAWWREVDGRKNMERAGDREKESVAAERPARKDTSRPPERERFPEGSVIQPLEKERLSTRTLAQLEDMERRLHKRMEADAREKGDDRDWVAWQESFDTFREQLAEIRELEEQNALLHLRNEEREHRAERMLPVPGTDGRSVPSMSVRDGERPFEAEKRIKGRDEPSDWALEPYPERESAGGRERDDLDWIPEPRRERDPENEQEPDRDRDR